MRQLVSVIVPTLNEVGNVAPLLERIDAALRDCAFDSEVLIADGGSSDGTQDAARAWRGDMQVRVIDAASGRGLAGDVLVAAHAASGDVVVVMDADLSHPPEALPRLVAPVLSGERDIVFGSRYIPGGSTPDWPWRRRFMSRAAGMVAWPLTDVHDPTSGFFALRRERLLAVDPDAEGFKIGLEALLSSPDELRTGETPIEFRDRTRGSSKMSTAQAMHFVRRLMALTGGAASGSNAWRFALGGVLGLVVDLTVFQALWSSGVALATAHITSFFVATVVNYVLNSAWAFRDGATTPTGWRGYGQFLLVALLALFLRGGVLATLHETLGMPAQAALVVAVFGAAAINFLGCAFFVFSRAGERSGALRWSVAAVGVVGYTLLLRLSYLGLPDLLPEEAYYWNYAQHPALGYLDHPPMIAWLIGAGTSVFGDTELGVRAGAFLCWIVTACCSYLFARNLWGKSAALRTVLLVAALPFFFAFGFFSTPDAPLLACWAGALFCLERAMIGERRAAWWGVGLFAGLGLLSKYTIALLGPATLLFMLVDRRSRRWLLRPEPYGAALLALLLFSPVIVWNAQHGWASFAFQTTRRVSGGGDFSVHLLLASAALLLTPIGMVGAVRAVLMRRNGVSDGAQASFASRRWRFTAAFTLVPLGVFLLFSLRHEPKLNWTGPLWLAALPALAAQLVYLDRSGDLLAALGRRMWRPTIAVTLLAFGGFLHYLAIGLPGAPYSIKANLPVAWEEFGAAVESLEDSIELEIGEEPLVVGMDKYFLASEMAFYRRHGDEGPMDTASRNLFRGNGLMYEQWQPAEEHNGRAVLLVSLDARDLGDDRILGRVAGAGPIVEHELRKGDRVVGSFFSRLCTKYRAVPALVAASVR